MQRYLRAVAIAALSVLTIAIARPAVATTPLSLPITQTIQTGSNPSFLLSTGSTVWSANSGSITGIDTATYTATTTAVSGSDLAQAQAIAQSGSDLLLMGFNGSVSAAQWFTIGSGNSLASLGSRYSFGNGRSGMGISGQSVITGNMSGASPTNNPMTMSWVPGLTPGTATSTAPITGLDVTTGIAVSGSYAVVIGSNGSSLGGIAVINIANPLSPSTTWSFSSLFDPVALAISNGYVYVVGFDSGSSQLQLLSFQIVPGGHLVQVSTTPLSGSLAVSGIAASGNLVAVSYVDSMQMCSAPAPSALQVFDVTDPSAPTQVADAQTASACLLQPGGLAFAGSTLYAADFQHARVLTYDVSALMPTPTPTPSPTATDASSASLASTGTVVWPLLGVAGFLGVVGLAAMRKRHRA